MRVVRRGTLKERKGVMDKGLNQLMEFELTVFGVYLVLCVCVFESRRENPDRPSFDAKDGATSRMRSINAYMHILLLLFYR